MPVTFRELDVVALTADVPEHGLVRGQVGTIVHVYAPDTFEVEFVDNSGRTYALATLRAQQLMLLHYEPVAAA
jgi:hypothetical protein